MIYIISRSFLRANCYMFPLYYKSIPIRVEADLDQTSHIPSHLSMDNKTFCTCSLWVPFLNPNWRKKGTLVIKGLLWHLESYGRSKT